MSIHRYDIENEDYHMYVGGGKIFISTLDGTWRGEVTKVDTLCEKPYLILSYDKEDESDFDLFRLDEILLSGWSK